MNFLVTVTKPTAQPGEVTTVTSNVSGDTNDLRLNIGRSTRAIDWRVSTVNEQVIARTRKNLKRLGIKIPGF
jgi:hypothetical protein